MLGTDNTLRSGHLLLLLLVASSIILGIGYLNEMYQRIQLQADIGMVGRQAQYASSERMAVEHKAAQLQMKLEAANQEKKRLEDMHTFQSKQESAHFEKEKKELLEKIFLKEEAIAELQDQFESLKERFDNLHSVMGQFERNQSTLLEKFATQSTQCMNVISMMGVLCTKNKIQNLLPLIKEKKTLTSAAISQSANITSKPENISVVPNPEYWNRITKAQMPLLQAIADNHFLLSGGKQRYLTVAPSVNDLSSEPETTVSSENEGHIALVSKITAPYVNIKAQDITTNANKGVLNEIIKHFLHKASTKGQRSKEKRLLDPNNFGNYSEQVTENEDIPKHNQSSHVTNSRHWSIWDLINATQEKIHNLTSSEDRIPETTNGEKSTKETPNVNLENAISTLLDVYNTEEKDGAMKEEKTKYEDIYLTDPDNKDDEKILQIL